METLTRRDLEPLIGEPRNERDVVSLFLPTHRQKEEAPQDLIRLKNLLRRAEEQLAERGHKSTDIRALLEPGRALLDNLDFWGARQAGVAIFLGPGACRTFHTPLPLDEAVSVSRRYDITPLLPLVESGGAFHVLAVNQKRVQLLWATRFSKHVVEVEGLPPSIVEALNYEPRGRSLQAHLQVHGPRGAVLFRSVHGQGGESDFAKEEVLEYFRMVDKALRPVLREKNLPLVFAGVDYLFPIYREANTYPHLEEDLVGGSPDSLTSEQLHCAAWAVVAPRYQRPLAVALRRASEGAEFDEATCSLPAILRGACEGRVETLLVARRAHQWGTFRADTGAMATVPGPNVTSEDLVNRAAVETLLHDGNVYVYDRGEMPQASAVAALYRYPATTQETVVAGDSGQRE